MRTRLSVSVDAREEDVPVEQRAAIEGVRGRKTREHCALITLLSAR